MRRPRFRDIIPGCQNRSCRPARVRSRGTPSAPPHARRRSCGFCAEKAFRAAKRGPQGRPAGSFAPKPASEALAATCRPRPRFGNEDPPLPKPAALRKGGTGPTRTIRRHKADAPAFALHRTRRARPRRPSLDHLHRLLNKKRRWRRSRSEARDGRRRSRGLRRAVRSAPGPAHRECL